MEKKSSNASQNFAIAVTLEGIYARGCYPVPFLWFSMFFNFDFRLETHNEACCSTKSTMKQQEDRNRTSRDLSSYGYHEKCNFVESLTEYMIGLSRFCWLWSVEQLIEVVEALQSLDPQLNTHRSNMGVPLRKVTKYCWSECDLVNVNGTHSICGFPTKREQKLGASCWKVWKDSAVSATTLSRMIPSMCVS